MSVSSPCEVCNRADVEHACDRCSKLVCGRHFDDDLGLCIECAAALTDGEDRQRIPGSEDMPDGVDTYRF
ncbi:MULTISPECIES: hypothetical protein [Salinibaculum]|uniref:hypothetical protein n=1 Tax=Salinibaculum TaxID=2732368 RepID=UPI0030CF22A7